MTCQHAVEKNADVIYSVVWLQGTSGIMGTLIGFVLAAQLAKLAEVRYTFMVPIMFIFILMGARQRQPRSYRSVGCGWLWRSGLFHAAFWLPAAGDDSGVGIGRPDGEVSLSLGGELRVRLAFAPGGHRAADFGYNLLYFHRARQA